MVTIRQSVYVIMVLLLSWFSCMGLGWVEDKPVLDDDGNVITEEEISANTYYMHKQYYDATLEFSQAMKLKPAYTDAESAFKLEEEDGSEEDIKSQNQKEKVFSFQYGCLGAYQGLVIGGISGLLLCALNDKFLELEYSPQILLGAALIDTVAGGALGSQAKTQKQKEKVRIGAGCATGCIIGVVGTGVILTIALMFVMNEM